MLAGTADAATASRTYTGDFKRVASVTDFLGRRWTMRYDVQGNLIETQDPNGNSVKRSYNGAGQVVQCIDALGKSSTLSYAAFDLAQVSDPLSRSVQFYRDGVGRTRGVRDALGNVTNYDIDALDRVTRASTPKGVVAYA